MTVGINLRNVRAYFAADRGAAGEEWIVRRRGPIRIKAQDYSREKRVVRAWSTKSVIEKRRGEEGAVREVLQPAAPLTRQARPHHNRYKRHRKYDMPDNHRHKA